MNENEQPRRGIEPQSTESFDQIPPEFRPFVESMVRANFDYYREVYQDNENLFREDMAQNWLRKREAFALLAKKLGLRELNAVSGRNAPAYGEQKNTFYALLSARASYILVTPNPDKQGYSLVEYSPLPMREGEQLEQKTMEARDIVLMGEKNSVVRISDRESGKMLIETIVVEIFCQDRDGGATLPGGQESDLPGLGDGLKQQLLMESSRINKETFK